MIEGAHVHVYTGIEWHIIMFIFSLTSHPICPRVVRVLSRLQLVKSVSAGLWLNRGWM